MKTLNIAMLLLAFAYNVYAQKLPEVQDKSVYLPTDTRVDGKAKEWSNQFSARSKNNSMSYTIANDNENLYIIIRLDDYLTIDKAVSGGITFSVTNNTDKEKQITIEYLTTEAKGRPIVKLARAYKQDSLNTITEMPDLPLRMTRAATQTFKTIKVTGLNKLKGEIISIYNTEGIEIATGFDEDIAMITEVKFPIHQFAANEKLKFRITLNGIAIPQKASDNPINTRYNQYVDNFASKANFYRYSPGMVDGQYVLIKK